ncbi:unnamed protein product [Knipowitschia caucasica]|uniref:E3 ubiquitin-protein ligase Hakai n=1 Tax=Knipowitschia caucasica TaxID=637954 RepID=A0AAV2IZJ1_KNICA
MDQSDNDLQGSDGSGSLGGPDVRRRIPIKLISKQPLRSKPPPRAVRTGGRVCKSEPGDEENFGFKQEERFDCGAKDVYGNQRRFLQPLFWDCKVHLIGEKDKLPIHFCDKCGLPIHLYGRMIPCKHVFCYECALLHEKKGDKMCPGLTMLSCSDAVQRIEQCQRGSLWMCSVVPGCKRTYLSERDLQAHVNHRHMRSVSKSGRNPPSDHPERYRGPPPHLQKGHHLHDPYSQPPPGPHDASTPGAGETFRIATVTTRKHSNLITVPIQDDSGLDSGPGRDGMPQPPPSHHHSGDYATQPPPVVSHPHHLMPQQHFGPPPPPPPPINHPMQHPQGSGTPHMVYNQAPPPMSSAPPPITPPPGHILGQMPPYMNHPPPQHSGPPPPVNAPPPPHHYNPNFPEDQATLSPPFTQPGGLSPGLWPAPRGPPPPPRMQGPPPPQGQMGGPPQHHPDQGRYRPYYQ